MSSWSWLSLSWGEILLSQLAGGWGITYYLCLILSNTMLTVIWTRSVWFWDYFSWHLVALYVYPCRLLCHWEAQRGGCIWCLLYLYFCFCRIMYSLSFSSRSCEWCKQLMIICLWHINFKCLLISSSAGRGAIIAPEYSVAL